MHLTSQEMDIRLNIERAFLSDTDIMTARILSHSFALVMDLATLTLHMGRLRWIRVRLRIPMRLRLV